MRVIAPARQTLREVRDQPIRKTSGCVDVSDLPVGEPVASRRACQDSSAEMPAGLRQQTESHCYGDAPEFLPVVTLIDRHSDFPARFGGIRPQRLTEKPRKKSGYRVSPGSVNLNAEDLFFD